MLGALLSQDVQGRLGSLQPRKEAHRFSIGLKLWKQCPTQCGEGIRARGHLHAEPTVGSRRKQACIDERALPRARRTDQSQQVRVPEPFPDRLNLGLTTEEKLCIFLLEGRQAWVRALMLDALDPEGHLFEGTRQVRRRGVPGTGIGRERLAQDRLPGTLRKYGRLFSNLLPEGLAARLVRPPLR